MARGPPATASAASLSEGALPRDDAPPGRPPTVPVAGGSGGGPADEGTTVPPPTLPATPSAPAASAVGGGGGGGGFGCVRLWNSSRIVSMSSRVNESSSRPRSCRYMQSALLHAMCRMYMLQYLDVP
jgi:hypothetical protein